MLTISLVLLLGAFGVCLGAALGRAPLWVAVILLVLVGLLGVLPR
jgi:hypothetical protein